ncbi:carboxypeptidase-like regulatory domain-containing protein [Halopenitus persicus]|uniref:carboxypeptidase-like regulatory domain-containing protein n=1 Tax=Halopenitus persicus TaxID=1048396 RepID=UPI0012FE259D|nr:carboxypeptidase-like regulatory domain-containing protein [Halopenitus persicus]
MRALPVLFAALLLLASAAGGAVLPPADGSGGTTDGGEEAGSDIPGLLADDDGPVPQTETNDTDGNDTGESGTDTRLNVLGPPIGQPTTVSIRHHSASLGPASRLETGETTAAIRTEELIAHVEAADTASERNDRLVAAEDAIRRAEARLHERQRQAIAAHSNGELSDQELLVEFARIAATAEVLQTRLEVLAALADETAGSSLRTESLAFRLNVYSGPVREYALETFRGGTTPDRIYVETRADVVVLAAIDGDQYLREVYRGDRWDRSADGSGRDSQRALERTLSAYPRIDERSGSADTLGTGGVTRVTVPFDGGRLRTFVSAGDGDVFIEHQRRDLETFADGDALTTTQDGIGLTVDRSYPAGPVRVTAIDQATGDPIPNASVTVAIGSDDSVEVGTTNEEGQLWLLSPARSYRVTIVDDPRVAWISEIRPTDPPRIPEPTDDGETAS